MNDNTLIAIILILCVSSCGEPDIWDAAASHYYHNECQKGQSNDQ